MTTGDRLGGDALRNVDCKWCYKRCLENVMRGVSETIQTRAPGEAP